MSEERPILFSGPMVRAILEGRKTQTRRVVKCPHLDYGGEGGRNSEEWNDPCPYGVPGDRLWVRENFSCSTNALPLVNMPKSDPRQKYPAIRIWYQADNNRPTWAETKWRPSIHMPRWASRITLEVKAVRVERLQQISEADIRAEGVIPDLATTHTRGVYYTAWMALWKSINGPESWDTNPWVWVVEFERVV